MFVEFDSLQDSSRVWVYQSGRKLTEGEESAISKTIHGFTQQWTAHGQPLKSSFKIVYHQFIVLAADESVNEASGCSIDDSVHVMKEIDHQFKLDLFNRSLVGFLKNENVMILSLNELPKNLDQGVWDQSTLVFNNLVNTKQDLAKNWVVPLYQTWLKRYLSGISVEQKHTFL